MKLEAELINQESELKKKLYEKTGIPSFENVFYFYEKKFDVNLLYSMRIALLTSDIVNKMTFEHLWEFETFKDPISLTQEELILNVLMRHFESAYRAIKDKDYAEMRDNITEIDSLEKVHLYNIYNIQSEEQRILDKNIKFISQKLDDLFLKRKACENN